MKMHFYIKPERYSELKKFIRENTPSVRFICNPYKHLKEMAISIEMKVEDGNKLNELFNKWHDEDNPKPLPRENIFLRTTSFFKSLFIKTHENK